MSVAEQYPTCYRARIHRSPRYKWYSRQWAALILYFGYKTRLTRRNRRRPSSRSQAPLSGINIVTRPYPLASSNAPVRRGRTAAACKQQTLSANHWLVARESLLIVRYGRPFNRFTTSPPVGGRSIAISEYVCLHLVCLSACISEIYFLAFWPFSSHIRRNGGFLLPFRNLILLTFPAPSISCKRLENFDNLGNITGDFWPCFRCLCAETATWAFGENSDAIIESAVPDFLVGSDISAI